MIRSVAENLCAAVVAAARARRGVFISQAPRPPPTGAGTSVLSIRSRNDPQQPIATLSGGNQQKVLLGRWLESGSRVLVLVEPTRGVDVGARAEIYRSIRELAADGIGVLVVTSDYEEVVQVADRAIVMARGAISARPRRRPGHGRAPELGGGRVRRPDVPERSRPSPRRQRRRESLRRLPEVAALLVVPDRESIFFSIKSPYFLAWDNWLNILTAIAVIGIVAAPGTLLMTAGQFDLSVGSITAFTSVILANLALSHSLGFSVAVSVLRRSESACSTASSSPSSGSTR